MKEEICMPNLGMTMLEGKVGEWYVKDGDYVEPGTDIAEVYSDSGKLQKTMQASVSGTVKLLVELDTLVNLGTPIAIIEDNNA